MFVILLLSYSDKTVNQLLKPISELKGLKEYSIKQLLVTTGIIKFEDFANKFEGLAKDTIEVLEKENLHGIRNCFLVHGNESLIEMVNTIETAHRSPVIFKQQKVEHADHFLGIRFASYKDLQWSKEHSGISFCKRFASRIDDRYVEILNQVAKEHHTTAADIKKALTGFGFNSHRIRSLILRKANNRLASSEHFDASLDMAIDQTLSNINLPEVNQTKGIDKSKMTITGYLAMQFNITSSKAVDFIIMNSNKAPMMKTILKTLTLHNIIQETKGNGTAFDSINNYYTYIVSKVKQAVDSPLLFSGKLVWTTMAELSEHQFPAQGADIASVKIPKDDDDDSNITFNDIYMKMFSYPSIPLKYHQFKLLSIKDILDLYAMEDEMRSTKKIKELLSKRMTYALKTQLLEDVWKQFNDFIYMDKPFSLMFDKLTDDIKDLTALGLPQFKVNVLKTISRRYSLSQLKSMTKTRIQYKRNTFVEFLDAIYEEVGVACKFVIF